MEMVVKGGYFMNLTIGYQDVCVVSGGKEKCAHALEKYKCVRVNMHFIY